MKTVIISLLLVFWMGTLQAQKVVKLDPATVTHTSTKVFRSSDSDILQYEVKEDFSNQFMSNPIKFVETKFDYNTLGMEEYDQVEVKFINKKGYLSAIFDENGELIKTTQSFKQIALPRAVMNEIYKEHMGWVMVSNHYTASGKGNKIDKELYRFKFANGNEIKRIKFVPKRDKSKIASN